MQNNDNIPKSDIPKLIQLCNGGWVRQEIDNIAWFDMGEEGLVVVDALEVVDSLDDVLQMMQQTVPNKKVKFVLNTHLHYDHVALNDYFATKHNAEIINVKTREILKDGLRFFGNHSVVMYYLPDAHTADDCIIWLPEHSILFVGDIFGWGLIPWDRALTAEKYQQLKSIYEYLISFEAKTIIAGHGPLLTTEHLRRWLVYFDWAVSKVRIAIAEGLNENQIRNGAIPPPEDMCDWWRFCQWKHSDTLHKICHAVVRERI